MRNFVIPSIDLLDGGVVRLYKGDYDKKTIYNIDIDELLERYKNFNNLHIVDLNGAKGDGLVNVELVKKIRDKFKGKIQIGGGIRSVDIADRIFDEIGIDRVVLGTIAVNNFDLTKQIIDKFGNEKIALAIDCELKDGKFVPKTNGWKFFASTVDIFDLLLKYENLAKCFLVTDISFDGVMSGSNIELYRQIRVKFPNFVLQASGGVSSVEDIKELQEVADFVIVGKALYEGLVNDIL